MVQLLDGRPGFVVFFLWCSVVLVDVNCQTCAKIDDCTCQFEDGTIIDLKSIANNDGTSRYSDLMAQDNYYYSYNPCYAFNEGTCANAAACQKTLDGGTFYLIGEPDTADFTFDIASSSVQIVYTAPGEGAGTRITYVNLVCDPRATDPIVVANGEIDTQQYSFTLTHRCTCPGLCGSSASTPNPDTPTPAPGSPGSDDSLDVSIGTVICIVVLGLLVVYLATGITFQRVKRQRSHTKRHILASSTGSNKGWFCIFIWIM